MPVTDAGTAPRKGWVPVMPAVGDFKLQPATEKAAGPPVPQKKAQPPQHALIPKALSKQPPPPPPRVRGKQNVPDQDSGITAPQMEAGYDNTLHRDALTSSREDPFSVPCSDFFFDSDKVLSLNSENFTTVLTRKDATLVMFYSDKIPESHEFQKTFSEAACSTKRENHAFAGVDCVANPKLCKDNGVCKLPSMRLYSKTYCIGEMKSLNTMSAEMMRQYVEMAPVTDESRMVACRLLNK